MKRTRPKRTKLRIEDILRDHVDPRHDLTGHKYHFLTVTAVVGHTVHGAVAYLADCDCGTRGVVVVKGNLVNDGVRSCGCDKRARILAANITHGDSRSDEHKIWVGMNKRCYNPRSKAYADYGGRGVTVSEKWRGSYEAFLHDMGRRPTKRHSIERKDVNAGYSAQNCRWATPVEQANNTTRTRRVLYNGERTPLAPLCRKLGVHYMGVLMRLYKGKDFLDAVNAERRCASPLKMYQPRKVLPAVVPMGDSSRVVKHGYARQANAIPEYSIWCGIVQRTRNPKSKHYGGAGIRLAPEWHDFPTFLKAVGPRPSPAHSIERADPRGNYEPGNVSWETIDKQANNKRSTIRVMHEGERVPLTPLCRKLGIDPALVRSRLHAGKTDEEALRKVDLRVRDPLPTS